MQLEEYQHAIEAFQRVKDLVADIVPADILLARAVAQAQTERQRGAVETLEDFLSRFPEHPYAGWAQSFRGAITERRAGRQIALLIGNGSYENRPGIRGQVPGLQQVNRDLDAVRRFLMEDCGYVTEDICVLTDAEATRDGVINVLRSIAERTTPDDTVLLYRRGHGTRIKSKKGEGGSAAIEESVSVFYDYDFAKNGFLTAEEVHGLINQIPAREKVVITDEDHAGLDEYAQRDGSYTLYQACSNDQIVSILPHEGAFTQALVGQMRVKAPAWRSTVRYFRRSRRCSICLTDLCSGLERHHRISWEILKPGSFSAISSAGFALSCGIWRKRHLVPL